RRRRRVDPFGGATRRRATDVRRRHASIAPRSGGRAADRAPRRRMADLRHRSARIPGWNRPRLGGLWRALRRLRPGAFLDGGDDAHPGGARRTRYGPRGRDDDGAHGSGPAVVAMVALLPSLATIPTHGAAALLGVGFSIVRAGLLVTLTMLLAMRLVPALLERVARTGSQELFLLVVVCVCLAAGYLAQRAGLSLELGAFLAGLVVSESDFAHEVFNQVRPLRDLFASLFFVSIGMLLDPALVLRAWLPILA